MIHLFHKWSDWAVTEGGDLVGASAFSNQLYGRWLSQERRCHFCGKVQLRITKGAISFVAVRMVRNVPYQTALRKDGVA